MVRICVVCGSTKVLDEEEGTQTYSGILSSGEALNCCLSSWEVLRRAGRFHHYTVDRAPWRTQVWADERRGIKV